MTPNSEQVKAIAERIYQRLERYFQQPIGEHAKEILTHNISSELTEALSAQPTEEKHLSAEQKQELFNFIAKISGHNLMDDELNQIERIAYPPVYPIVAKDEQPTPTAMTTEDREGKSADWRRENLSPYRQQPTEKKIIAVLDDSVERETLRKALEQQSTAPTASAEELWGKYRLTSWEHEEAENGIVTKERFIGALSEATEQLRKDIEQLQSRIVKQDHLLELTKRLRRREELTTENEQLRKELEEKTLTNGQMSEIINNCERIIRERNAQVSELTAEVERLKLFRKNVVEFLLLSEKQGSIVSSNQCTDTETAFASADDRFFVVDNSANDKYQNLGFVYRKASRGKV